MGETITAEELRQRRQEWECALDAETRHAERKARELEQHRLDAERYQARIDELNDLLAGMGQERRIENVIPMRQPADTTTPTKPSQRYRIPGATTDIVALAYATPGIDAEQLITTVYEKYREQGTSRDTIHKMVNRLIREKYAAKRRGKLFLEDVCKRAWESSPLFLAS